GAIGQMCEQVADPYLLVQRPPHVRADELRPASRVALRGQHAGGLGRKTRLGDGATMEQRLPPPQQIPVPLVAVLRRLGDDALDGGGEAHAGEAVVLNQVLRQRRLARATRAAESDPHAPPPSETNPPLHAPPRRLVSPQ